jgi:hypothetical protein
VISGFVFVVFVVCRLSPQPSVPGSPPCNFDPPFLPHLLFALVPIIFLTKAGEPGDPFFMFHVTGVEDHSFPDRKILQNELNELTDLSH